MSGASVYSAIERLRDGRLIEIRALRTQDKDDLIRAVGKLSAQSLYRRFFGVKRHFTNKEIAFFLNIDFTSQVALVAVAEEHDQATIIAGGRYVVTEPGEAELAFAVVDQYQGHGIGTLILTHLAKIARQAGITQFVADVLPSNAAMLKVFEKSGLRRSTKREAGTVHVLLEL